MERDKQSTLNLICRIVVSCHRVWGFCLSFHGLTRAYSEVCNGLRTSFCILAEPGATRQNANKKMKRLFLNVLILAICYAGAVSCGGNGSSKNRLTDIAATEDSSANVNTITQSLPSVMVIPSDQSLMDAGFLTTTQVNGKTLYNRDYNGYLMANNDAKLLIQAIQNSFVEIGYPLTDLEHSLKALATEAAMDEANNLAKDAKTLLMANCSPDITIELNFSQIQKQVSRTQNSKVLQYSLSAIDAFSNKAVASLAKTDLDIGLNEYISEQLSKDIPTFTEQIAAYFQDIVVNGREITFRVALDTASLINLTDDYNDMGDTYADWIREWVKTHAKKGTATMQRNTAKEIYFSSVRIANLAEDGTQFNAYDFANQFRKAFLQTFQIKNTNATQGLGDAYVIIK